MICPLCQNHMRKFSATDEPNAYYSYLCLSCNLGHYPKTATDEPTWVLDESNPQYGIFQKMLTLKAFW